MLYLLVIKNICVHSFGQLYFFCLKTHLLSIGVVFESITDIYVDCTTDSANDTNEPPKLAPRIVGGAPAEHGQYYGIVRPLTTNLFEIRGVMLFNYK